SVSEQVVHTTQVFMEIPSESTVKIVIGQSDEIIGGDNGGGTSWTVSGTVRADDGQLVTSGTVEVCDVTSSSSVVLGERAVDGSGQYSVTFPSSAFENNGAEHSVPNLVVKYYDEAGVLLAQAVPSGPVEPQTTIDVTVGDVTQVGDRRVFGDVINT